jgi:hypothetical protein
VTLPQVIPLWKPVDNSLRQGFFCMPIKGCLSATCRVKTARTTEARSADENRKGRCQAADAAAREGIPATSANRSQARLTACSSLSSSASVK